jgi:hypothetical protein
MSLRAEKRLIAVLGAAPLPNCFPHSTFSDPAGNGQDSAGGSLSRTGSSVCRSDVSAGRKQLPFA